GRSVGRSVGFKTGKEKSMYTVTITIGKDKMFGEWKGTENLSLEQLEALVDQLNDIICERYPYEDGEE
ncbi:MAG: hypothetical protein J6Q22_00070, partial [Prevotella sp.]|nr:hypothetical protein [Prevotella sp.]